MIVEAGIPHFLRILIIILVIWYLFRLISKSVLFKSFRNTHQNGNRQNDDIHYTQKDDTKKHISPDVGEYVDYEEIEEEDEKD